MQNKIKDYLKLEQNQILGFGSFSKVYRVLNTKDKKVYAMKQIDLDKLQPADQQKMYIEIDLHQILDHPNIIKFHESFKQGNILFNVLEYASNGCLFYYINSKNGFNEKLSLRFLHQVCQAVKYLHDRNIMHRDIKPENILLDPQFNVKLCDFGYANIINEKQQRQTICGTYCYMSPEVANEQAHSSSVDIWSLGILLFELLHGKPPFEVQNFEDIKQQIKTDYIEIRVDLHPLIKDLMKNLLKKDADKRYNIDQVLAHPAFKIYDLTQQLSEQDIQHITDVYVSKAHSSNMLPPDSIMDKMISQNPPQLTKYFDDIYTPDVRNSICTLSQINGYLSATDNDKNSQQKFHINFFDVLEESNQINQYKNEFTVQDQSSMTQTVEQQDDFFDRNFSKISCHRNNQLSNSQFNLNYPNLDQQKTYTVANNHLEFQQPINKHTQQQIPNFTNQFYSNEKNIHQKNEEIFNKKHNQNQYLNNNRLKHQNTYNYNSQNQIKYQTTQRQQSFQEIYYQKVYSQNNQIQSTTKNFQNNQKQIQIIQHNMGNNICKTADEKEEEITIEPYVQQQRLDIQKEIKTKQQPQIVQNQNYTVIQDQSIEEYLTEDIKNRLKELDYNEADLHEIKNQFQYHDKLYNFPDNVYYQGDINNYGQKNGYGREINNNNEYYEGQYQNGKFQGFGRLINARQDVYTGQFRDGKFHGQGQLHIQKEGTYKGNFENGKRNGNGEQIWNDGSQYKGQFVDDMKEGQGEYLLQNGSKYIGQFLQDQFEGQGTFEWISGKKYSGEFHNNMMHGQGEFVWPNGQRYIGDYKENLKHGEGVIEYPDGITHKGQFVDGQKHGRAILTDKNGKEKVVQFENGKAIKVINQLNNFYAKFFQIYFITSENF